MAERGDSPDRCDALQQSEESGDQHDDVFSRESADRHAVSPSVLATGDRRTHVRKIREDFKAVIASLVQVWTGRKTARDVDRLSRRIIRVCRTFEKRSWPELNNMIGEVELAAQNNCQRNAFKLMVDLMFAEEVTWVHVISFATFCAVLARHCSLQKPLLDLVDKIAEWAGQEIDARLGEWLAEKGGIECLLFRFERHHKKTSWLSKESLMRIGLTAAAGVTFVTVGIP